MASLLKVITLISALLLTNFVSGDSISRFNPPPLHHGQWLPRIDSETSNHYQDGRRVHLDAATVQQPNVQPTSTYPQHKRHPSPSHYHRRTGQAPTYYGTTPESKVIQPVPEPMPRHDQLQQNSGLNILSSLIPKSILNLPQVLQQQQVDSDTENFIDTSSSNNNGPFSGNFPGLLQNPLQQQDKTPGLSSPLNLFGNGNRPSLFSGHSQSGGYAESSQEAEAEPEPSGEENGSGGVFTRIRNILPFGKGFLSGFLKNGSNEESSSGYGYGYGAQSDNDGNDKPSIFNFPNLGSGEGSQIFNSLGGNSNSNPNPFSFSPNLLSQQSGSVDEAPVNDNSNDDSGSGLNILPSLPNPFQGLRNLLSNFSLPSLSPSNEAGGYDSGPASDPTQQLSLNSLLPPDLTDSTVSPLQSLVDSGFGGVLGPVLSVANKLLTIFKQSDFAGALPWITMGSILFGPVFSAALAAMIIGIVYISVYIPAWAIRNEDLDGEFFILPIQQLLNILGIPDPLEEIFGRSFTGRAAASLSKRNATFGLDDTRKNAFLAGTALEKGHCMEKIACEWVGRKLLRTPSWQDGYFVRGIKLILNNSNKDNIKESSWPSVRFTKSILEAVGAGLTPESKENSESKAKVGIPACVKYTCDLGKALRIFLKTNRNENATKVKLEKQPEVDHINATSPIPENEVVATVPIVP